MYKIDIFPIIRHAKFFMKKLMSFSYVPHFWTYWTINVFIEEINVIFLHAKYIGQIGQINFIEEINVDFLHAVVMCPESVQGNSLRRN